MLKLVIGTRNPKKREELVELLKGLPLELQGVEDYPGLPEVEEDGKTFRENAIKKATALAKLTGEWLVAEDSGLEVDALNGDPGVRSARYAGEKATYAENNRKLLGAMDGIPPEGRTARFRCVIALASPQELLFVVEGQCEGRIAQEVRGEQGFGYDPVFYLPDYGKTFAELGPAVKNQISHRARALKRFREMLKKYV
ncbi:MAG: XTP/dITP diphosphatase [Candidatus Brocadiales bacterium]